MSPHYFTCNSLTTRQPHRSCETSFRRLKRYIVAGSSVLKFADDTKTYRPVSSISDCPVQKSCNATQLYKSLVRPHLDYCSVVWNPHYLKDIHLLERAQHRFTRLFPDLKSLPYKNRLNKLGLWTLEERRNRSDLIELFKMIKGLSVTPCSLFSRRLGTHPHEDAAGNL